MSYYFCIVGTRDNPLFEAELSVQPASEAPATGQGRTQGTRTPSQTSTDSNRMSIFGFGSALGALAGGLGNTRALMGGTPVPQSSLVGTKVGAAATPQASEQHMLQMIAHGSLDVLEDQQYITNTVYVRTRSAADGRYFRSVDRVNDWTVSAFLVPGSVWSRRCVTDCRY